MTNTTTRPVSNSVALKVLGRARIMQTAWFLLKNLPTVTNLSQALKRAWAQSRQSVAVDMRREAEYATFQAADKIRAAKAAIAAAADLKARKAEFANDKASRSPLNPYRAATLDYGFSGCAASQQGACAR